jgi:hypothetical protein
MNYTFLVSCGEDRLKPLNKNFSKAITLYCFMLMMPILCYSNEICPAGTIEEIQIDLRSSFGPIRDQKDSGWCFANASVDLFQQYLVSHNLIKNNPTGSIGDSFSAPQYAAEYYKELSGNSLQRYFNSESFSKEKSNKELENIISLTSLDGDKYKARQNNLKDIKKSLNLQSDRIDFCYPKNGNKDCYNLSEDSFLDDLKKCQQSDCNSLNEIKNKIIKFNPQVEPKLNEYLSNLNELLSASPDKRIIGGFPNGGDLAQSTLENMISNGICLEKNFRQNFSDKADENSYRLKFLIEELGHSIRDQQKTNVVNCYLNNLFPFIENKNAVNVLNKLTSNLVSVDDLLLENCHKNKIKFEDGNINFQVKNINLSAQSIDDTLKNQKPIFINYDPRLAFDTYLGGVRFEATHVSLIVGKINCSKKGGSSQDYYMIRNSFGKNLCSDKKNAQLDRKIKELNPKLFNICVKDNSTFCHDSSHCKKYCAELLSLGTDESINMCDENGYHLITRDRLERSLNIGSSSNAKGTLKIID